MRKGSKGGSIRAASFALVAATAVTLTACSTASEVKQTDASADWSQIATQKKGQLSDIGPLECGSKDVTIAYADDNASANTWRTITKANLVDQASKCPNVKLVFTDGQGSLQKSLADINGLIAQGVDGIIVLPDFGAQELPAMRNAMNAGIPVVGINATQLGGEYGKDYLDLIQTDEQGDAKARVDWIAKVLGGKGKIVGYGGTPGAPISITTFEGVQAGVAANPGLELLNDKYLETGFTPQGTQTAIAGALAKYPEIDAVTGECGTCAPGVFRAFEAAKRPQVPLATDDSNGVACEFYKLKATNPKMELLFTAARNTYIRVALNKVNAALQGLPNDEPSIYNMPVVADSTDPNKQPKCVQGAPDGAIWSSTLTEQQVLDAIK